MLNHFFKRSLHATGLHVGHQEENPVTKIMETVLMARITKLDITVSRYPFLKERSQTTARFESAAVYNDQLRLLLANTALDGRLVEFLQEGHASIIERGLAERLQDALQGDLAPRAAYEKPLKDEVRKIGHEMLTAMGILWPGVNPKGKGAPVGKIQVRRAHTSSLYSAMTFSALGAELPSGLGRASFSIDMETSPWDERGWALHLTPWHFSEMQLHWLHDIYPKVLMHLEQQGYAISPVGWGN